MCWTTEDDRDELAIIEAERRILARHLMDVNGDDLLRARHIEQDVRTLHLHLAERRAS